MTYYFQLQYKRIKRRLSEWGISPILGILLAAIVFVLVAKLLFYKTVFAAWIFAFFGVMNLLKLGELNRNDQLKSIFKKQTYYRIRILENLIIALPFLLFLLYEKNYWVVLGLVLCSILLASLNFRQGLNFTIPTPFKKYPFEFIVGFRKSIFFILLAYFLLFQANQVDNFNLGLFSLGLIFFLNMSYYFKPENGYFVWIFSTNSTVFLSKKITTALICSSLLTMPISVVLGIVFFDKILLILGIQLLGFLFLSSMILAKYAAFPKEISVPQAILYGLSLWFPPMLLIVMIIFYKHSKRSLNPVLE